MADIKQGIMVSLKRGKHAGQAAEVVTKNDKGEVVLKLDSGEFVVANGANVRVPDAATITEDALADIVSNQIKSLPAEHGKAFDGLISQLDDALPGFASKVSQVYPV